MINFYTKNLNPRLYSRLIRMHIYDMFDDFMDYVYFMRKWDFEIYPSQDAPNDPFFDGKEGVGGVTGLGKIKLYLEDKKTNLIHDIFKATLRKNMMVATHEIGHALLIYRGRTHRVALRNDDWSGHKKGTILNFSAAEIHDRHIEGRFLTKNVWFWDWKTLQAHYLRNLKYVDIDDLV